MNFESTQRLLDVVSNYVKTENISIESGDNKDWKGRKYIADFVEIIKEEPNQISFEVTGEEIIIFFFNDHVHFDDYSSALDNNDADYVERAIEFLKKMFTLPIETRYTTKGDRIIRNESYFVLPNNEKESCVGTAFGSAGLKNFFKKSVKHVEIKKFDRHISKFVSNSP